jgi:hypothetical protein
MSERERWTGRRPVDMSDAGRAMAAGYEPGPDGYYTGRDPRSMTQSELLGIGHAAMSPMQAIRARCLDCCAGSPHEVRLCVATSCVSWPFRMGKNPWRAPPSEAQLEAGRRLARSRSMPANALEQIDEDAAHVWGRAETV